MRGMKGIKIFTSSILVAGVIIANMAIKPPASKASELPPLVPREVLFGNPEITGINLSPDGKKIVYLAPYQGVLNLWVRDLDGKSPPRLITKEKSRPQRSASWSLDSRYLISSKDNDGDENTVLVRIDPSNGEKAELTPTKGVKAIVTGSDKDVPDELIVELNDRDPRFHDIYILNISSGKRKLLYQATDDGKEVSVQRIDGRWQPTVRAQVLQDGGSAYEVWIPDDETWIAFMRFNFEDTVGGSGIGGFSDDGQWLYGTLTTGEDLPRLVRWRRDQLKTCKESCMPELVHRSSSGALGIALDSIENGEPILIQEVDLRSKKIALDPGIEKDLEGLRQLANGNEFSIVDRDLDDKVWLAAFWSDRSSPSYWLWDREKQQGKKLFDLQPALNDYDLVAMESINLKARDGRRLPTYLTRTPIGKDNPQPLVLVVHGGPQSRDYWGLDQTHQLLANRGYHVMSVNFRGSTGFGKAHLLAGEGEWYGRMQDDLVDAVEWAITEGIADKNRIVIMGASYGGYAALSGLTRDPELFAASVAEVGPSNLRTLLESIPPYWESGRTILERMIGVDKVDLDAISPINHVNKIRRPLLLGHGANDPRVKIKESETIATAMQSANLPIDFVVFPDEGHVITDPRNALAMTAVLEAFLKQHIGGRAEPFGDSIQNSSMEWRLRSIPATEQEFSPSTAPKPQTTRIKQ